MLKGIKERKLLFIDVKGKEWIDVFDLEIFLMDVELDIIFEIGSEN